MVTLVKFLNSNPDTRGKLIGDLLQQESAKCLAEQEGACLGHAAEFFGEGLEFSCSAYVFE